MRGEHPVSVLTHLYFIQERELLLHWILLNLHDTTTRPARIGEKSEARFFSLRTCITILCHDFFLTKCNFMAHEP